jgi:hypothetical protein
LRRKNFNTATLYIKPPFTEVIMTVEERQDYLQKVFKAALGAGLCRNTKQFAELLGIDRTGLSTALNGGEHNLTESLIKKTRLWAKANGLEDGDGNILAVKQQQPQQQGVWIPPETLELYNNIAATCRNLSEILKKHLE